MQSDSPIPVVTVDGVEVVYQVNHLSHFLLTRLLLPSLSHTPSRVVHVSSSMHYAGHLDHLAYSAHSKNKNTSTARLQTTSYCDTKLMNVIFSNSLQNKLTTRSDKFAHFTSVSVHPGLVLSELDRGLAIGSTVRKIREVIARPTADGAVAQVTLATLPALIKRGGGGYYEDHCIMNHCTESVLAFFAPVDTVRGGVSTNSEAQETKEQEWLWDTSSEIVGLEKDL
jgi:NAD(P)-dependent dehydrogenase (short-subunit alcohol dehydrogenase family)